MARNKWGRQEEGGGGEGTTNYNDLINKPQIDGTELSGNKTPAQLGLQPTIDDLDDIRRGAGAGETALQEVPDTYRTSSQQDEIDNAIKTRLTTIEGKEIGWDAKADPMAVYTTIPSGGMLPDAVYHLGTLTGNVTLALAEPVTGRPNHYYFTFQAGTGESNKPTLAWDTKITSWQYGAAPSLKAAAKYEVSVLNGLAVVMEVYV